jgi:hypothetical protein
MSPRTTLAAAAVAACAVTLALGWPTPTHADGASPFVQYMVDGTKIADVVAKGTVARDPKSKTGWSITVKATNEADHAEEVPIETDLMRRTMSPMARAAPVPQTVWSQKETVTVPAHGTVALRYDVPAAFVPQLAAAEKVAHAAQPDLTRPMVSFAIAFAQPRAVVVPMRAL